MSWLIPMAARQQNPHWELALAEYMQYLVDHGIPEEHVYHMTHTIPAKLLGIEE